MSALGLTMPEGVGGFYLFCNFEKYRERLRLRQIESSDSLAELLLLETGIAALPGSAFGRPIGELTMRLSYVDFDGSEALRLADTLAQPETFSSVCPKIRRAIEGLERWLGSL
jgi:aspartate aminotransferase